MRGPGRSVRRSLTTLSRSFTGAGGARDWRPSRSRLMSICNDGVSNEVLPTCEPSWGSLRLHLCQCHRSCGLGEGGGKSRSRAHRSGRPRGSRGVTWRTCAVWSQATVSGMVGWDETGAGAAVVRRMCACDGMWCVSVWFSQVGQCQPVAPLASQHRGGRGRNQSGPAQASVVRSGSATQCSVAASRSAPPLKQLWMETATATPPFQQER